MLQMYMKKATGLPTVVAFEYCIVTFATFLHLGRITISQLIRHRFEACKVSVLIIIEVLFYPLLPSLMVMVLSFHQIMKINEV